jgi:serine/threonine protein kinase
MILYSKDYKPVEFEDKEPFDHGSCGYVYRYDDKVLKVFRSDCGFDYKMRKKYFNILKNLDAPSLVNLYDYFFKYKISPSFALIVHAYLMEYIEKDNTNILTCDRNYIVCMLEKIEKTIQELSDRDILIWDLKSQNFILNADGLNFIDLDLYRKRGFGYKNSSYIINKNRIIMLLNHLIMNALYKTELKIDYSFIKMDDSLRITENVMNNLTEDNFYYSIKSRQEKVKIK